MDNIIYKVLVLVTNRKQYSWLFQGRKQVMHQGIIRYILNHTFLTEIGIAKENNRLFNLQVNALSHFKVERKTT